MRLNWEALSTGVVEVVVEDVEVVGVVVEA